MNDVLQLLRPGLLQERVVALSGPVRPEIADALGALGATRIAFEVDAADEAAAEAAAAALGAVDALVVDAGAPDTALPLHHRGDGVWVAARSIANVAWIEPERPGGKLVFVAPAGGDGAEAEALRAALENLSRTLSIEWSRFGIRSTTITPGERTTAADVAAIVAYLVSPAGDYFSGARLDLGAYS